MQRIGASLSIKQCRNFAIDPDKVLRTAIKELGLRRFRLMTYWNEHEKERGVYDFTTIDKQLQIIEQHGGEIAMCLGVRQPRWPESHWPSWAKELNKQERNQALIDYITAVVQRYKKSNCIVEWQLENEALLKSFGHAGDFDRKRLKNEYALIKKLDADRPIIMTTSTSWGIPVIGPIPDRVGFSLYRVVFNKGKYRNSLYKPWIFKLRAGLIKLLWHRKSFIHELQAEPWGPKEIWHMSKSEQDKSMSLSKMRLNIVTAKKTSLLPIDLWGLEWWYWRKQKGDARFWRVIQEFVAN